MEHLHNPAFDPGLMARHGTPVAHDAWPGMPRLDEHFGERELRAAIERSNQDPIPRDLGVWVQLSATAVNATGCAPGADAHLAHLQREIELLAACFDRDRPLARLHLGHGALHFLGNGRLAELFDSLAAQFSFSRPGTREFSADLDPRLCDRASARQIAEAGIDRISVAVQGPDPAVQRAPHRVHDVEQVAAVVAGARVGGVRSIKLQLNCDLSLQAVEGFARALDPFIALGPERVAIQVHDHAHPPARLHARPPGHSHALPATAARFELLQRAAERLTAAGYRHIGMGQFALPGDNLARAQQAGTLQHGLTGYSTTAACELVGLGIGAFSQVGEAFSQNVGELAEYRKALDQGRLPVARGRVRSADERLRADLIQQLLCRGEVPIAAFEARHLVNFGRYFRQSLQRLAPYVEDGLVARTPERLVVTPRGRFLLRNIAHCFDAHAASPGIRHSRAV